MNDRQRARFAELRSALQQPPSAEAWRQITHHLDGLSGDAQALEQATTYAEGLLARWPDALRVLPRGWLTRMLRGVTVAQARVARVWRLPLRTESPARKPHEIARHLSAQPALAYAREVEWRHGELPTAASLNAFGAAAARVEALGFTHCELSPRLADALGAMPGAHTLTLTRSLTQGSPIQRERRATSLRLALASATLDTLALVEESHTLMLLADPELTRGLRRLIVRGRALYEHEREDHARALSLLAAHEALRDLRALELTTCGVDDATLHALAARDDLRLEALRLGEPDDMLPSAAPGAAACAALVAAPWFGGLRELAVRLSPTRGPMLSAMAEGPAHLRALTLTPDSFRGVPHQAVAGLLELLYSEAASSLERLEVGGSAVDADVIEALRSSDTLRGLQELRLRAPAVDDRTIARLHRPGLSVQLLSGAPE